MKGRDYRRLSIAAKQRVALEASREPGVACPNCGTQTAVGELLTHALERCAGKRETHPLSRWITGRQAVELGVPHSTLSRWVQRGVIRARGAPMDRQYLLRDLVVRVVDRRASMEQPRSSRLRAARRKGWLR